MSVSRLSLSPGTSKGPLGPRAPEFVKSAYRRLSLLGPWGAPAENENPGPGPQNPKYPSLNTPIKPCSALLLSGAGTYTFIWKSNWKVKFLTYAFTKSIESYHSDVRAGVELRHLHEMDVEKQPKKCRTALCPLCLHC